MKVIFLAAGYGTRMQPLTENMPKALLNLGGKPIIEYTFQKLEKLNAADEIIIVTNSKFFKKIKNWVKSRHSVKKITILNDGSTNNESRLGAIRDIEFGIKNMDDDVLVVADDHLFEFDFSLIVVEFFKRNATIVTAFDMKDKEKIRNTYSTVTLNKNNKIIDFEEKPPEPKSTISCAPIYLFPKDILPLISKYLSEGNNPDAPGYFIQWLFQRVPVYGLRLDNKIHDIGTLKSYEKTKRMLDNRLINYDKYSL